MLVTKELKLINTLVYHHTVRGRIVTRSLLPCYGGQEAYVPAFPVITGREEPLPQTRLCVCVCAHLCAFVCDSAHVHMQLSPIDNKLSLLSCHVSRIELVGLGRLTYNHTVTAREDHMTGCHQFEELQCVCMFCMWLVCEWGRGRRSEWKCSKLHSDAEHVTLLASSFRHSDMGDFNFNVSYSFIPTWQESYRKQRAKQRGFTAGEQRWVEKLNENEERRVFSVLSRTDFKT